MNGDTPFKWRGNRSPAIRRNKRFSALKSNDGSCHNSSSSIVSEFLLSDGGKKGRREVYKDGQRSDEFAFSINILQVEYS